MKIPELQVIDVERVLVLARNGVLVVKDGQLLFYRGERGFKRGKLDVKEIIEFLAGQAGPTRSILVLDQNLKKLDLTFLDVFEMTRTIFYRLMERLCGQAIDDLEFEKKKSVGEPYFKKFKDYLECLYKFSESLEIATAAMRRQKYFSKMKKILNKTILDIAMRIVDMKT
tara:strand:- start:226 stop:735 length:510 start_codon:yes stop_codon:yes gene_type:complete